MGNATVNALFIKKGATRVKLTMVATPAEGGSTSPSGALDITAKEPMEISAVPADAYRFVQWEAAEGVAVFGGKYSARTTVTLSTSATVKAVFAKAAESTTLTVKASEGGSVIPAGDVIVIVGESVDVSAVQADGYAFDKWVLVSGAAVIAALSQADTVVSVAGAAVVEAMFVKKETPLPGNAKVLITIDSSKSDADKMLIKDIPLPVSEVSGDFVNVVIDGMDFDCSGSTTAKNKYVFKSAKGVVPTVVLTLDFKTQKWTIQLAKASLGSINPVDGLDIELWVDGGVFGWNLALSDATSWTVMADTSEPIQAIFDYDMEVSVLKGNGKYDTTKPGADTAQLSGKISNPGMEFAVGYSAKLLIDGAEIEIPASAFKAKGSVYTGLTTDKKFKLVLDFGKGTWTFTASKAYLHGIAPADGLEVYLSYGSPTDGYCGGAAHVGSTIKSTLKYP